MGPETTSKFYLELIFSCQKKNKIHRPSILVYSVPITYRTETNDILKVTLNKSEYTKLLVGAAKRLERGGADFLVMPCNSLHFFIDKIRKSVNIPVLSIIEETVKFLKKERVSKVGVVSTLITRKYGLYENALNARGIKVIVPSSFQQAKINKIVLNLTLNKYRNKDKNELLGIINDLGKKGVDHIVLACTDLQLLITRHSRLKIYDTMKIFADVTVREILKD